MAEIISEPPVAEEHRLLTVRGPDRRPDENPWHADCSCGWRSPLMRFAGDAALLGAQHVIDAMLEQPLEEAKRLILEVQEHLDNYDADRQNSGKLVKAFALIDAVVRAGGEKAEEAGEA